MNFLVHPLFQAFTRREKLFSFPIILPSCIDKKGEKTPKKCFTPFRFFSPFQFTFLTRSLLNNSNFLEKKTNLAGFNEELVLIFNFRLQWKKRHFFGWKISSLTTKFICGDFCHPKSLIIRQDENHGSKKVSFSLAISN